MIVTVDGNIGAGKTTVLQYLKKVMSNVDVDLEPVEKWQPWLDKIYKAGNSVFEFQIRVWLDRCWPNKNDQKASLLIERSPFFQRKVFIPANIANGKLDDDQTALLDEMYDKIFKLWQPNFYVYLRSDPAKCAERIIRRARQSEDSIPIHYLQQLHDLHEEALIDANNLGIKVVVVNIEGKTPEDIGKEIHNSICSFLE